MTRETKIEIMIHATRWTANMCSEVFSNYNSVLPEQVRQKMKAVLSSMWEVERMLRMEMQQREDVSNDP